MNYKKIENLLKKSSGRSAWSRGVTAYAFELLEHLKYNYSGKDISAVNPAAKICNRKMLLRALLNGAPSWQDYSDGGCSLIYDGDIAERLCNPSELKRTKNGERRPNSREIWLDVQARALFQAACRLERIIFPR